MRRADGAPARAQSARRIEIAIDGEIDPRCLTEAACCPRALRRRGLIAEAAHTDGIASFVLTDDAPLPWHVFARTMETLTALRGPICCASRAS